MSDYFKTVVSLHLHDADDLRNALDNPEWMNWTHPRSWQVRSEFIIGIIREIVSEGQYPYNSTVQRRVESRLGIPEQGDNGTALSRLVYNTQGFRHSDDRIAAGYEPATQEVIERAGEGGEIQLEGESLIGKIAYATFKVRSIGGNLYAMQPRKRKYALAPNGQPVKIIKHGKPTESRQSDTANA